MTVVKILRTESHFISKNHPSWVILDELCFKSKNLYNYANYLIREKFFKKEPFLKKFDLVKQLAHENQFDYRELPAQTSQQIIYDLFQNWKSFFRLVKSKTQAKCKPPKYKDKQKGRNHLIFTNQQCKIKDGFLVFPKSLNLRSIKTKAENLREVRIIPAHTSYRVEIVHLKEFTQPETLDSSKYIGIDLGINNLMAITSNEEGFSPILINGRPLKSINQFYNKKLAQLKSELMLKHSKYTSQKIQRLHFKRNLKVKDYLHKASRAIINSCILNNTKNIVIGYNENWKTEVNLGKKTNQKFVQIPHLTLINMIKYKAEEVGITVILTEESYTSQTDHLGLQPFGYSKRRIHRGLFQSKVGLINADINGAIGILRKVIGDGFLSLPNRGQVLCPVY